VGRRSRADPREPARAILAGVSWLAVSIVLSVVLTVVLNVALRVFPGLGERIGRGLAALVAPRPGDPQSGEPRVRWYFPWKAMLVVSLGLTVLLSLLRRLG
jgi:hypothetical protein